VPAAAPAAGVLATAVPAFTQVSAGAYHTCARTVDGRAYCWGEPPLGDGTSSSSTPIPTEVTGGLRFLSVNSGTDFSCGITTDQLAYCWGTNYAGQLGDGTRVTRLAPVPVAGGASSDRSGRVMSTPAV
jgi:hypothetical protein